MLKHPRQRPSKVSLRCASPILELCQGFSIPWCSVKIPGPCPDIESGHSQSYRRPPYTVWPISLSVCPRDLFSQIHTWAITQGVQSECLLVSHRQLNQNVASKHRSRPSSRSKFYPPYSVPKNRRRGLLLVIRVAPEAVQWIISFAGECRLLNE